MQFLPRDAHSAKRGIAIVSRPSVFSIATMALDAETETMTQAAGFETEAKTETVYLITEAETQGNWPLLLTVLSSIQFGKIKLNHRYKLDNCNCHGQLPGFTIMNVRMMLCIVNVQN